MPIPDPLTEVLPESLDELFSRDPLELSSKDLDNIISVLLEQRKNWLVQEAQGARRAKAPKTAAKPGLALDDLGL